MFALNPILETMVPPAAATEKKVKSILEGLGCWYHAHPNQWQGPV